VFESIARKRSEVPRRDLAPCSPPSRFLDARDPTFIRSVLPVLAPWFERYHEMEVRGLDKMPAGPALAVGNHNGGSMAPDMFGLMVAYWRERGADEPAYGLAHDLVYRVPILRDLMAKVGAVPAHPQNALRLLARGAKVLVYPGGDLDAFKTWERRHEVVFGERKGFVRLALRAHVPIVPVVGVGAHEAFHVLTDGVELARRSGLKQLFRLEALPVALGLPWGLVVGPMGYWPFPVRMKIRVLDPIAWPALGADAAEDDAVVTRCRDEVREVMQAAMDELVAEGGFGRIWPRRPA
jgi:1-acyl-sn-glycerol-3-phosphate acyltransferase